MSTLIEKNTRQRERAYLQLREMLLLHRIPEGTRLRETAWADKLGVNRMALREAFARLAGEGFITRGEGSGYHVPLLTEADTLEIRRTRLILECGAIYEMGQTGRLPARRLAPLRQACDDMQAFLERGYYLGVIEADRRFHECLVDAAGNGRLSALYRGAPLPLIRGEAFGTNRWLAVGVKTLADHRAIVRALASGKTSLAMKTLAAHLRQDSYLPVLA